MPWCPLHQNCPFFTVIGVFRYSFDCHDDGVQIVYGQDECVWEYNELQLQETFNAGNEQYLV